MEFYLGYKVGVNYILSVNKIAKVGLRKKFLYKISDKEKSWKC